MKNNNVETTNIQSRITIDEGVNITDNTRMEVAFADHFRKIGYYLVDNKHGDSIFGDLDFTKFARIQNPFIDKGDNDLGLTSIEKEKLIELFCDTKLKHKF